MAKLLTAIVPSMIAGVIVFGILLVPAFAEEAPGPTPVELDCVCFDPTDRLDRQTARNFCDDNRGLSEIPSPRPEGRGLVESAVGCQVGAHVILGRQV